MLFGLQPHTPCHLGDLGIAACLCWWRSQPPPSSNICKPPWKNNIKEKPECGQDFLTSLSLPILNLICKRCIAPPTGVLIDIGNYGVPHVNLVWFFVKLFYFKCFLMDDYNMYKCYAIHYEHKNSKLNVVTEKQSLGKKRKTEKH